MKTMITAKDARSAARAAAFCLLALGAVLCQSREARAQWTPADAQGNINSTNTGNVGVGTATAASKLDVSGASGVTVRTDGASAGFSFFDRPAVPGDQLVFQGNAGAYTVLNTATKNANFGSERLSGLAMWTVDNAFTSNATQFQLQNSPAYGGVIFTQKFGTGAQGDKKVSFQTAWNQLTTPTQFVLDTTGNVGIGTATPTQRLEVLGNGKYVGPAGSWVIGTAHHVFVSDDGSPVGFQNTSPNAGSGAQMFDNAGAMRAFVQWHNPAAPNPNSLNLATANNDPITFVTNTNNARMTITGPGNVGIGTTAPSSKLHVAGDITVDGNINAKYQDVAEWVPTKQKLAAGTVVVLDKSELNHVRTSSKAYDTGVAGVISAQPGLSLGERGEGKVLVATTGRVKVKVDASRGAISVGDLLVTSEVEGVAMKSQPLDLGGVPIHRPGTLIGKALEPLEKGTGEILVLLSLQ